MIDDETVSDVDKAIVAYSNFGEEGFDNPEASLVLHIKYIKNGPFKFLRQVNKDVQRFSVEEKTALANYLFVFIIFLWSFPQDEVN